MSERLRMHCTDCGDHFRECLMVNGRCPMCGSARLMDIEAAEKMLASLAEALEQDGHKVREVRLIRDQMKTFMPDDFVVVRNRDADEAGDYRIMRHADAVDNPNWEICPELVPSDLD